ncbi:MAG: methyltransferase domain-containing protein, partial [Psychromonas sp.]|nr:methyltransferase domain-containing protein [Psychromonas sp.]
HFKVWSAASSSGEEAYSLAMLLSESAGTKTWDILATDINSTVLKKASQGIYFMERLELLDPALMKKYCLKGVREQAGVLRVNDKLRQKISFHRVNLTKRLPEKINTFDVIFLRNVLIYFNNETKKQVVNQLIDKLKPGGYFFISHSETLSRVTDKLKMIQPSIYMKL